MSKVIKRNNPGNMRPLADGKKWQGQTGVENNFVVFGTLEDGVRAMIVDLHTKVTKKKLNSIKEIISVWAPPSENDTNNYIQFVSKRMNIVEHYRLPWYKPVIKSLVKAMIKMEHGIELDSQTFEMGWLKVPLQKRVSSY